jgi:hypothetical protein
MSTTLLIITYGLPNAMLPVDLNDTPQASLSSSSQKYIPTRSNKSPYYKVKDIENWIALPPEVKLPKIYLPFVLTQPLYSRS